MDGRWYSPWISAWSLFYPAIVPIFGELHNSIPFDDAGKPHYPVDLCGHERISHLGVVSSVHSSVHVPEVDRVLGDLHLAHVHEDRDERLRIEPVLAEPVQWEPLDANLSRVGRIARFAQ